MKAARCILRDLLLDFVVNSNLLAVYNFLYTLAILVLAGNLSLNGYFFEIILLLGSKRYKRLNDLLYFLGSCLGCNDLTLVNQLCYLVAEKRFSKFCFLA